MHEAAQLYRLSWWQKLLQLELPHTAIGLVWNSMMSVAGGWFSLMVCEMFVLGNRDLRLPGLGSYLQSASNAGATWSIVWGLMVMVAVIILIDQIVWRPMIAWSEKFKFEQVEATVAPTSFVLSFLRRSNLLTRIARMTVDPARERLTLYFARENARSPAHPHEASPSKWVTWLVSALVLAGVSIAIAKMALMLATLTRPELKEISWGAGATFLRVEFTLALAALWTIPVGVFIGMRPRLSALAQPIAQIAASVPAPALFPIVLLLLIRVGGGIGNRLDRSLAFGYAMVHPVQRNCGS